LLQVSLVDPSDPVRGFNCIAVSKSDAESIKDSITIGRVLENGMVANTSIIGAGHCLGLENLMRSGLIVCESAAAYDETFSLTYVTARSVGIGAYLVRLGQRVIQKEINAAIILKGFSALNKVLVHDVYLSNDQLDGAKIKQPNGITQLVVQDDVHGISAVRDWLSFVPDALGQAIRLIESRDAVTREIEFLLHQTGSRATMRVIVCLIPLGMPELSPVAAKTITGEDDSRCCLATHALSHAARIRRRWQLRPSRGGRHAGSLPTRKVTTEILTTYTAAMGKSPSLWRRAVVAGAVSITALEHLWKESKTRIP
jgi:hypothetical protein